MKIVKCKRCNTKEFSLVESSLCSACCRVMNHVHIGKMNIKDAEELERKGYVHNVAGVNMRGGFFS